MKLNELNCNAKLRRGITTGACAAAAALGAYSRLKGGNAREVSIILPDGLKLDISPAYTSLDNGKACAAVVKDAGDDPDVTHNATIIVKLEFCSKEVAMDRDYIEKCGCSTLIIRGGEGVGLCTKKGLAVPVGKSAINPGPRKLIADNLLAAGFGGEPGQCLLLEISVPEGKKLARKTLNPRLGVENGISILGVSGIVEPFSNSAYIHSIKLQIGQLAAGGATAIALATGTRTQSSFLRDNPKFPPEACIRIGDFIADSLGAAADGIKNVHIACMPGKLYKYACGHRYTHAHKVELDPALMANILEEAGIEKILLDKVKKSTTVKEAASGLEPGLYRTLLKKLAGMALENMREWNPEVAIFLHVYDDEGQLLLSEKGEVEK
ncbi:MAG: cobalt-precorrin-5B (C(1))-methyltransferase CbiD [Victivallales bacterium]|nr:cobalt-precorrin-5B (C(1))-methyltransferase CbiD [Victivallales bacterium]